MNSFKRINNLSGWIVFAIAFATYASTVEPTASFWDCGEFIAVSDKLMVPHPSGAPLFLLIGRMFALIAGSDVTRIAYWINMSSVLASAFTILFMFWTITLMGRKVLNKKAADLSQGELILLMGAGAVGSLAYTFSDTFWFSAVEAEVYAMSSFFTALVVWAFYKWELIEDEAAANRWLIFIAYIVGLSIGVHLLNLVTIPALAILYYFKKYPNPTYKGGFLALLGGFVVLGIINNAIIPGLPSMAFWVERLFVNDLGMGYGSGVIVFTVLFLGALAWGIRYSQVKRKVLLNVGLLSLLFVLIGYASYILVLVRANYNPPINENDPKDALSFTSYLKREQYGDRSLLYGPIYTSQAEGGEKGSPFYRKRDGKYEIYDYRQKAIYAKGDEMLLPRLWSEQPDHVTLYEDKLGIPHGEKPTFGQNLQFLFTHQMGHMYMRYLLWNFVGRESDIQDAGVYNMTIDQKKLPERIANNRAHNNYFWLPLILGILGFLLQFRRQEKDYLIMILMFLLTGLALVVFLNSPPAEPRERDYIYVGSFYFFAIWIGLGVMQLAELFEKIIKNATARAGVVTVACLAVPAIMGQQNWDDHDRSNRYHSVDFAKNLLNSCDKNAILFTGGDNDTFPLWYVQEVEGFRTDVRVCNLSLLGTDWYIQQMKRKTYESQPLPISMEFDNFINPVNDALYFQERPEVKDGINLKDYMTLLKNNDPAIRYQYDADNAVNIVPSSTFFMPVNVEAVRKMPFMKEEYQALLTDNFTWTLGKGNIYKPQMIQLDIIAQNEWKRPVYFSTTLGNESYLNLKEFMQLEGLAYRLMPFKVPNAKDGFVNTDIMYNNMMKKTVWRGMNDPKVYYNEFYDTPIVGSRIGFLRLAGQLITEGKKDKAKEVLNKCFEVMPDKSIPYDQISVSYIKPLIDVGEGKRALEMADTMFKRADQNLNYYLSEPAYRDGREINSNLYVMNTVVNELQEAGYTKEAAKYNEVFTRQYKRTER
jgi:hypothetical protein